MMRVFFDHKWIKAHWQWLNWFLVSPMHRLSRLVDKLIRSRYLGLFKAKTKMERPRIVQHSR